MDVAQLPTAILHALTLVHPEGRFVYRGTHRTHVELRRMSPEDAEVVERLARERFEALPNVNWARLNAGLNRLVIAHDLHFDAEIDVLAAIEEIERRVGVDNQPFGRRRFEQAGSDARAGELVLLMGTNMIALGAAVLDYSRRGRRLDLGVAATMISALPALRDSLDRRVGSGAAELGLGLANGAIRTINRSYVAALSKIALDLNRLLEADANLTAWETWEPRLCARAEDHEEDRQYLGAGMGLHDHRRVLPMPWGPVESYVDRATLFSMGTFAFNMARGKPLQTSATFLYAGLPLPAKVGREAFLSGLGRRIADSGGLVLRHHRLAHLDRVTTVLIDARIMTQRSEVVDHLDLWIASDVLSEDEARAFVSKMLLGLDADDDHGLSIRQVAASRKGNRYALLRDGGQIGEVQTRSVEAPGLESLRRAASSAGVELRIVGEEADLQGIGSDVAHELEDLEDATPLVRRLQRDGRVVMYIGGHPRKVFADADVGVWCWRGDWQPVWRADAIIEGTPSAAALFIHAAGVARGVSRRSVRIAQAEAAAGATIGMTFPAGSSIGRVFVARHLASLGAFVDGLVAARGLPEENGSAANRQAAWHALGVKDVLQRLDSRDEGLSAEEVAIRLEAKLDHKRPPGSDWLSMMVDELRNPMTPVLLGGAGLSAAVSSAAEAGLVLFVLGFDAAWATAQRQAANKRIDALSDWDELRVRVLRDGKIRSISPADLVRGDIVQLRAGDVVPADLRILDAEGLEADESALTGESVPVPKQVHPAYSSMINEQRSLLFQGTSVAAGHARAVVIEAGDTTRAAQLAQESERVASTHAPRKNTERARLQALSQLTMPAAGVAGLAVFGMGLLRGARPTNLLRSAVSLSVAAVPEGLTLLPTVAGLAASSRLSKKDVRVRDHHAPSRMANVDVLCLDKTGTLTDSGLRVSAMADPEREYDMPANDGGPAGDDLPVWVHEALCSAAAASRRVADNERADVRRSSVNGAVLDAAALFELPEVAPDAALPFDARRAMQASRVGRTVHVKGAPERILERATLTDRERRGWTSAIEKLSSRGLHVLAIARLENVDWQGDAIGSKELRGLKVVGLMGLSARPRPGTREALARFEQLGVRVVMLTGDHPVTATSLSRTLGLAHDGVTLGSELDQLDAQALLERVDAGQIFARVTPRQKARIIETLQRAGKSVAMLGDGANDAAALRLADVGIVVDTNATPAAIDASDLVISGDLRSIVEVVSEGRVAQQAVRDGASVLVGGNLGEIGFVGVSGLIAGGSPLTARQLLLVNLITDAVPALTIAARGPQDDLRGMDPHSDAEFDDPTSLEAQVAWRGAITATAGLVGWGIARAVMPARRAATVGMLSVVGAQMGQTYLSAKGDRRVRLASLGSVAALVAVVQTPGVSHACGSRPLGPVGLGIAASTSLAATLAASQVGRLPERIREAPARALTGLEDSLTSASGRFDLAWQRLRERSRRNTRRLLRRASTMTPTRDDEPFDPEVTGADILDGDLGGDDVMEG